MVNATANQEFKTCVLHAILAIRKLSVVGEECSNIWI